jgi:hypothetical protein
MSTKKYFEVPPSVVSFKSTVRLFFNIFAQTLVIAWLVELPYSLTVPFLAETSYSSAPSVSSCVHSVLTILVDFVNDSSWESVVGTVTRLWAGQSGVQIPVNATDFSLFQNIQTSSRSPLSLLISGYHCPLLRVKQPGCELTHSLPFRAEVKNGWR